MGVDQSNVVVALLLLILLAVVGVYDLLALVSHGRFSTVTVAIVSWSRQWPILPFIAGVIIGHLFFPAE